MASRAQITGIAVRLMEIGVGAVFIYAGALKAWNPATFAHDIQNYRLTPWAVSVGLALYLPWLEIFAGACLAIRKFQAGAITILTALMFVFIAALATAWARDLDVSCGCFGGNDMKTDYPRWLGRDVILLVGLWFVASSKRLFIPIR